MFHTPEEYKEYIESKTDELQTAVYDAAYAALYKLFSLRDDSKMIQAHHKDKNSILVNFKDGIGIRIDVSIDHAPEVN